MKSSTSWRWAAFAVLLALAACQAPTTGRKGQIAFGGDYGRSTRDTYDATVYLEGEFAVREKTTVVGRIMWYDWEFDNDLVGPAHDEEYGNAQGLGIELRHYPKTVLDGFYVGAGAVAYFANDWEFRQGGVTTKTGDDFGFGLYAALGYAFRLTERLSVTPNISLTRFESDSPKSPRWYPALGVRLGFSW